MPRVLGLTVYFAVLAWYVATQGLPIDRIGQTGWIIAGIVAAGLDRTWRQHVRVFADWLPLLAALLLYDHTRGIADTLGMPVRVGELVTWERWLFGGELPTVWLQERLYEPWHVPWWEVGVTLVYFTHFVAPWAIAAVFYVRSRARWLWYIRRVLVLSFAGLATYILVPAAPPWFAAEAGEIPDQVARLSTRGWWELNLSVADAWLSQAQAQSNHVAALPSLHAAFSLLVVVAVWPAAWRLAGSAGARSVIGVVLCVCLVLFPLAMAFTLVYGGEHYMVDVLLGWLYVGLAGALCRWWEQRRGLPMMSYRETRQIGDDADEGGGDGEDGRGHRRRTHGLGNRTGSGAGRVGRPAR